MRVSISCVKVVVKPEAIVLQPQTARPKIRIARRLRRSAYQPNGIAITPPRTEKEKPLRMPISESLIPRSLRTGSTSKVRMLRSTKNMK